MTEANQLKAAREALNAGKYSEAERVANDLLAATAPHEENHAAAIHILADCSRRQGRFEESIRLAEQALAFANKHRHAAIKAKAWNMLGIVYSSLGSFDKELEYYGQALDLFTKLGDTSGIATVTGNIGIVYSSLGSFDKALEYFGQAHALSAELGDTSGVARVTGNIGGVYFSLGSYDKALEYYLQSLALSAELGDTSVVATVTGNIGIVYSYLGDYDQGLEYYLQSLALSAELGDTSGVARVTGNIGLMYSYLGVYDKALEYMRQALAVYEQLGGKSGIARVIGNLGNLYANQEYDEYDAEKAKELLLRAIKICMEIGAKKEQYELHKSLAVLFEKDKQWEEFAIQFKQYHELEKAVQTEEATKQAQLMEYRRKIEESERDRRVKIARFQEQEKILHNILPSQIAERIIDGEKTIADRHENVSVFFSDIVGFTKLSQRVSAEELVGMLNGIFTQFDQLARKHGLEKIKTIGDAYMAVCGAPIQVGNHAERAGLFALDVAELTNNYQTDAGDKIMIRIGLHSGSVVAGIIGENKFAYDLWGDAVNTASRMESHGEAGKIHVSEEFKNALVETHGYASQQMTFIERGEMEIKGKGMMKTYFLERA